MAHASKNEFSLDVSVDNETGRVIAAYFHIRSGKSARTKMHKGGLLVADYNADGKLLGIELLGECRAEVLDTLPIEKRAISFVRNAAPRELVPA